MICNTKKHDSTIRFILNSTGIIMIVLLVILAWLSEAKRITQAGSKRNIHYCELFRPVTVTTYFSDPAQCDNTWQYTADGSYIDSTATNWCAISQDLLKQFSYGDSIFVYVGDSMYNGWYIVHDCMHIRVKNTIDILIPPGSNKTGGLWKGRYHSAYIR